MAHQLCLAKTSRNWKGQSDNIATKHRRHFLDSNYRTHKHLHLLSIFLNKIISSFTSFNFLSTFCLAGDSQTRRDNNTDLQVTREEKHVPFLGGNWILKSLKVFWRARTCLIEKVCCAVCPSNQLSLIEQTLWAVERKQKVVKERKKAHF